MLISGLTACSYIEDLWGTLDRKGATRASEMNISAGQRFVWAQEQEDERREQYVAAWMKRDSRNTLQFARRQYNKEREDMVDFFDYPPRIMDDDCIRLSKDKFLHDFMAEKFADQLTGEPTKQVLRIGVMETILRTDDDLNCGGTVKWDDSTKDDIQFYRLIDDDGDEFWGWSN